MIERIWLRNFRRYRDTTFELAAGLNVVVGPNNAGKTTLLYAIEYALFGRIGRFKSIAAVLPPKERTVGVELVFRGRDGARYRLQRMHTRPPRSRTTVNGHFTLKQFDEDGGERYLLSSDFDDHEEALQITLRRVLGITRRVFDVAVNLRQGEIATVLAGAPQLDAVLGVTAAVTAGEALRAMALAGEKEAAALPVLEEGLGRMRAGLAEAADQIAALETELKAEDARAGDLMAAAQSFEAQVAAAQPANQALEDLEQANAAVARAGEALGHAQAEQARVAAEQTSVEVAGDEAPGLEAALAALDGGRAERAERRTALDRQRGDLAGRLVRRQTLPVGEDARCETCGQAIDGAHLAAELPALQAEVGAVDAAIAAVDAEEATARAERAEVQAALQAQAAAVRAQALAEGRRAELAAQVEAAQRRLTGAEAEVTAAERVAQAALAELGLSAQGASAIRAALRSLDETTRADRIRAQVALEALQAATGRVRRDLEAAQARGARFDRDISGDEAKAELLRATAATAARMRTLAAGFKALQKRLRERATEALARETFELHQALSGGDDQIKALRIDPARYEVFVTPTDVGREVPAHLSQGGGHRLLLGLAFKLAVARLVGACPFILLDEPTEGLDDGHREALLSRVLELGLNEQLILITHHPVVGELAARRFVIERSGKTSTCRVEAGA